jgi:hypothetical protein
MKTMTVRVASLIHAALLLLVFWASGAEGQPFISATVPFGTTPVITIDQTGAYADPGGGGGGGGLTDAELRATPVPVSGTVSAVQSGDWTNDIGNWSAHPCAYAENTVPADGATGCMMHAVRANTPTATSDDGKRSVLQTDQDGALWVALNRVVTVQPRSVNTSEFTIADADGAQTDRALVATTGTLTVTDAMVTCTPDTTATVQWRIGLAAATLPAASINGAAKVFHTGWYKSSGNQGLNRAFSGKVVGAAGEDIRITIGDPVGGSCVVILSWIED